MKKTFLSAFILKIIALFTMTIDHVGAIIPLYTENVPNELIMAFRIIGRLALPLFLFLLFEGMNKSKNKDKYLLRISILTLSIFIGEMLIYLLYMPLAFPNNILDLFLCALFLYLVYSKKKWMRYLAIIPFAYSLLVSVVVVIENSLNMIIEWLPLFVRPDYGFFSMLIVCLFYLSQKILMYRYMKYNPSFDIEMIKDSEEFNKSKTVGCAFALIIVNVIYWITFRLIFPSGDPFSFGVGIQTYSILASVLILFYNEKKGFSNKYFQYGSYFYFPLHIVIIFIIMQLIFYGKIF